MKNNNPVTSETTLGQLPLGGTLGILAYGYRGIMQWRQVRQEHMEAYIKQSQKQHSNEEN